MFSKSWFARDYAMTNCQLIFFGNEGIGRSPDLLIYDEYADMAAPRPPEKPKADWEATALDRLKQAKKSVNKSSLLDSLMKRIDASS